jgi:predicted transcriptional regulator
MMYDDDITAYFIRREKHMRTIVELPDEQIEALKRLSNDTRLSRAELMRRAVKEYLARHQPRPAEQAFGLWKTQRKDALGIQEQLRSEWD